MYYLVRRSLNILSISIPLGIGDLLHLYAALNSVKNCFSKIELAFYEPLFSSYRVDVPEYRIFLNELGRLLFSNSPFKIVPYNNQVFRNNSLLCEHDRILPIRPRLQHILCKNNTNTYGEYVTVFTKVRELSQSQFNLKEFLDTLKTVSARYKILILGEKEVEYNPEYTHLTKDGVYSLYQDYISALPADRIIDLTVPKLGITPPDITKLLNDCSIMNQAKHNIVLGIGGNFSLAISIGNVIGYRQDKDHVANILYNDTVYLDSMITRHWEKFISKLKEICIS